MIKKYSPIFVLAIFTLAPVVYWMSVNNIYPYSDAADYLVPSYRAYQKMHSFGILEGIKSAYLERTWKPIAFPLVSLPGLFLFKGNVVNAVNFTLITIQLLLSLFVYKTLCLKVSQWRAVIISIAILTLPIFIQNGSHFLTENLLALSVLAFFFYQKQVLEDWNSKSTLLMFFWLTIGALVRPVESMAILIVSLFLLLKKAFQTNNLSFVSLFSFALTVLSGIVLLGVVIFFPQPLRTHIHSQTNIFSFIALFLALFPPLIGLVERLKFKKNIFSLSLGISIFIIFFWYVPFIELLIFWIYQCTIGELAATTGGRSSGDFTSYLFNTNQRLGGIILVVFFISILLSWNWKIKFRELPWSWILPVLLFIVIGFNSQNGDSRYYTVCVIMLYTFVGSYINTTKRIPGILICLLLWVFISINYFVNYSAVVSNSLHEIPFVHEFWSLNHPPSRFDRFSPFYNLIKEKIDFEKNKSVRISFIAMKYNDDWGYAHVTDPWTTSLMALRDNFFGEIKMEYTPKNISYEEDIRRLHCWNSFLIVGPIQGEIDLIWDHGSLMGSKLIDLWKKNKILETGFIPIGEIIPPSENNFPLSFLILKTTPENFNC